MLPSAFQAGQKPEHHPGAAVVSDDFSIRSHSAEFASLCGHPHANLTGKALQSVLSIGEADSDGGPVPIRTMAGGQRALVGHFQPVAAGTSGELLLILTDPTATLTPIRPPAESTGDFASQLVRGLAHKMNNILTIFHGYSSLFLAYESLDGDVRDGLQEIKKGAESASELLERTVSAARQMPVALSPVNLQTVVRSVCAALEREGHTQVPTDTEFDPNSTHALADEARLKTVLVELARNAHQATLAAKINQPVLLHVQRMQGAAAGRIVVSVIDRGLGFPEGATAQVFDPFYTTKKDIGCVGLGLTVARTLIEQMQGAIEIVPADQGAEVRLILPAAS